MLIAIRYFVRYMCTCTNTVKSIQNIIPCVRQCTMRVRLTSNRQISVPFQKTRKNDFLEMQNGLRSNRFVNVVSLLVATSIKLDVSERTQGGVYENGSSFTRTYMRENRTLHNSCAIEHMLDSTPQGANVNNSMTLDVLLTNFYSQCLITVNPQLCTIKRSFQEATK